MCNYCANKKGSHSSTNERHCHAWGALCSLRKTKNHFKVSKECKQLQREKKTKLANQRQARSATKPFVLNVDEDSKEHFVDKSCALP